jgi:RNA polymerase-binding transcription factor DksA
MPKSKPAKPAPKAKKAAVKTTAKPASKAKAAKPAKPAKAEKTVKPVKGGKAVKVKVNGEKNHATTPARSAVSGNGTPQKKVKLSPFHLKQKDRLLQLRDSLLDAMAGVAKDNLRSRAEGSEASAFGMHQADAGSDAYDRDFALSLLSQEQDALYEIEEALKRLEQGTYGICEMSGKAIAQPRLEALPFARYTVECQSQLEKQNRVSRTRVPVTSLFGLTDEEGGDGDEEESTPETKEEKE